MWFLPNLRIRRASDPGFSCFRPAPPYRVGKDAFGVLVERSIIPERDGAQRGLVLLRTGGS